MTTLPQQWMQQVDHLRQQREHLREQVLKAWHEAPAWVRTPKALAGAVALAVIVLLGSFAAVVQGVVDRSEELHQTQLASTR